nr:spidroin-1 [Oryctolagus cuniculus]
MFTAAAATRRLPPQRRRRRRPLPSHTDAERRGGGGGGRGGVGAAAAAAAAAAGAPSGAPGEGQQERSPGAIVGARGAAATAAVAGNHTGASVPGCSSCCHDDDVTDATTGGGAGGVRVCGAQGGLCVVGGEGCGGRRRRERGGRLGGTRGGEGGEKVFSPPPLGRRLAESRARVGRKGSMTRPVGKATWERGGGAPMSWMDTERARGREGAGWGHPVFRAVEAALWAWPERRRSRLPRRPPFHILQRRRGQPHRRFFTRICLQLRNSICHQLGRKPQSCLKGWLSALQSPVSVWEPRAEWDGEERQKGSPLRAD